MAPFAFPTTREAATQPTGDGLWILSTSIKDFDDELLPNISRQRNQR